MYLYLVDLGSITYFAELFTLRLLRLMSKAPPSDQSEKVTVLVYLLCINEQL